MNINLSAVRKIYVYSTLEYVPPVLFIPILGPSSLHNFNRNITNTLLELVNNTNSSL